MRASAVDLKDFVSRNSYSRGSRTDVVSTNDGSRVDCFCYVV